MKIDRHELEQKLDSIINNYNTNKKVATFVKDKIKEHGVPTYEFTEVWAKNKTLDLTNDILLYLLTKYLYEKTGECSIKVEDYFTETEIKDGDSYKMEIVDKKEDYPLVFENVINGNKSQYAFYLSAQRIKKLQDSEIITYNFDTQRSPKHNIDKSGDLIKIVNINKQSVNEIAEFFLEGKFITNTITLNLLQDGNEDFFYNDKTKELVINSGQINIIDGFHRTLGLIKALGTNPNLKYVMEIRFTNWDVQKCRDFIHQENIRNKINSKYIQSIINTDKWGNKVITKLNDGQGDLKGKITTDFTLIRIDKAYAMFDMMANAIDLLWDIRTNMDVNNLANYLTDFFDYIIGYKVNDFVENLKESKENSVITMPVIFVGYLTIAKQLQGNDNWQNELKNILDNINFDIDNEDWMQYNVINKNTKNPVITLGKVSLKNIIGYFEELIK